LDISDNDFRNAKVYELAQDVHNGEAYQDCIRRFWQSLRTGRIPSFEVIINFGIDSRVKGGLWKPLLRKGVFGVYFEVEIQDVIIFLKPLSPQRMIFWNSGSG
jgi:hypothetical protein